MLSCAARMADPDDRPNRWPDLFVLASMAANVVLNPPSLRLISATLAVPAPFRGDVLSGVVGALGVVTIATYAALAASRRAAAAGIKLALVLFFAFLYVAVPTASDIAIRHAVGLEWDGRYVSFPHDGGVLQTEAATNFLLHGVDPYAARYHDTAMAGSHHSAPALWQSMGLPENPALSFFPYPPLVVLASVPFRQAALATLGWYDQRFVYLIALAALAAAAFAITPVPGLRVVLVAFFLFCPWEVPHFVQGYNDVLCVLFLALTSAALRSGRATRSGVWLALACGAKQFAWLAVPLWLAWIVTRSRERGPGETGSWTRPLAAFALVAALVFLPFLAWNAGALLHGLFAQSSEYPFRASGLGISSILVAAGWVHRPFAHFPLGALQAIAALAAIAWGVRRILTGGGLPSLLRAHALAVLAFVFFSRTFAASYLWLPSVLYGIAMVIEDSAQSAATVRA
jgi:hypothetical protein